MGWWAHECARVRITSPCSQRLAAYTGQSSGFNKDQTPRPSLWFDVLVHPEHVVGIILALHCNKALEIGAVGRLNACVAFVAHHEVDVTATHREWIDGLPVRTAPALQLGSLGGIGIYGGAHQCPQ